VSSTSGYADWFKPGAECELLAAMRARLGDDLVLFSRDGFNAVIFLRGNRNADKR
jgi:hypothetical protein